MIAADAELAEAFRAGEPDAIRTLVRRYGTALVAGLIPTVGRAAVEDAAVDVYFSARRPSAVFVPGDDLGTRLVEAAASRGTPVDEHRWMVAMATTAVVAEVRDALRDHHLRTDPEAAIDSDLTRHELRLQRRLAQLGDASVISAALADPDVWTSVDDSLTERIIARDAPVTPATAPLADPESENAMASGDAVRAPGARFLRPVLLGLLGAVLVLVVAIVALSAASGSPDRPDFSVDLIPTGVLPDVDGGTITVTERDAGLEIDLDAVALPRRSGDLYYEGRVVVANGTEITAGSFSEGDGVTLWGGVTLAEARTFRVVLRAVDDATVDDVVLKADLPRS